MSNILFFPFRTYSPHFETDLELIKLESENKDNNIYVLFCNGGFKSCDNNFENKKRICKACVNKRKRAFKIIKSSNIKIIDLNNYKKNNYSLPCNEHNIDSIKRIYIDSYSIGYSILSSLENILDESSFNDCIHIIHNLYFEGYNLYYIVKTIIKNYSIDKGYVYNARFCYTRAFFEAFLYESKPIYNHDRGGKYYKYILIKNEMLHDIDNYPNLINEFWDIENNELLKKQIADNFFKDRFAGKPTNDVSYTNKQNLNKLPENYSVYNKIVVIYDSSSYEYDYISDEYTYKFYNSQSDGINKIVDTLSAYPEIGIFLREHPNQNNRNNEQRANLRNIKANNFHLISAESDISSYTLLTKANVVITFNSTIGIEATYWRIPSILCSNSIYEKLNIAYMPSSHDELIKLILSDLKPIPIEDTLKLGYYFSNSGINYKYYTPKDLHGGLFMGHDLEGLKNKIIKLFRKYFPSIFKYLITIKKYLSNFKKK